MICCAGVFIKRNRSKQNGREYSSVLLVHGERVPVKRPPGRPRAGDKPRTKVVHRTIANLTAMPPELIALIERWCKDERGESMGPPSGEPVIGPAYGPLATMLALARDLGIERALGRSRRGRLALFLVLARVLHRGSRLSSVRWAQSQAVTEVLGLANFDEDDLYEALDWLAGEQERVERVLSPKECEGAVFLYDVTSSYFEGQKNELAAPGYNRDGKRFKKQIVIGLMTDAEGEPVSIQVYDGHRADPTTVADQIDKLSNSLGAKEIVLVGDRGMLKGPARELLGKRGFRYVTALTDPEVRRRLREGTLQLDLFGEDVAEVREESGQRLLLRRIPATQKRHRARRADQLDKVRTRVERRNEYVAERPRAKAESSLKMAQRALSAYKLSSFVSAQLEDRRVVLTVDEAARQREEELDGCYVVISDVPASVASAQTLWDRYGDLQRVERDFRRMKTSNLEIRPIFLRKAERTRGHALVTMLALKLTRAFERRLAPLGITTRDALDRLEGVRLLSFAEPSLGLWRLPTRWDAVQQSVLDVLPPLPAPLLSAKKSPPTA